VLLDEVLHEFYAGGVVEDFEFDAVLAEEIFGTVEILVLPDDDARDAVEQRGTGTHDARTERADQGELRPVSAASGVTDADGFGVGCGVSGLHAEVVAAGNDVAGGIGKNGTDRQAAFAKAGTGFFHGGGEEELDVHFFLHRYYAGLASCVTPLTGLDVLSLTVAGFPIPPLRPR